MLTLAVLTVLYFLPAILARNKNSFLPILLLNLFLGWTVIFWFVALIWSLAEPEAARPVYLAVAPPRYCCGCGAPTPGAYCAHCGRALA